MDEKKNPFIKTLLKQNFFCCWELDIEPNRNKPWYIPKPLNGDIKAIMVLA